jgi:hypothetical protein
LGGRLPDYFISLGESVPTVPGPVRPSGAVGAVGTLKS